MTYVITSMRSHIWCLVKNSNQYLQKVYADNCLSKGAISKWINSFTEERVTIEMAIKACDQIQMKNKKVKDVCIANN